MHYLLGVTLKRMLCVSEGEGVLGTWGALDALLLPPRLLEEPVGTSMEPVEGEPRCIVNTGPDALLVPVSCSPWWLLAPQCAR